MTLENYIAEAISSGKHKSRYTDPDNVESLEELEEFLDSLGYMKVEDDEIYKHPDNNVYASRKAHKPLKRDGKVYDHVTIISPWNDHSNYWIYSGKDGISSVETYAGPVSYKSILKTIEQLAYKK